MQDVRSTVQMPRIRDEDEPDALLASDASDAADTAGTTDAADLAGTPARDSATGDGLGEAALAADERGLELGAGLGDDWLEGEVDDGGGSSADDAGRGARTRIAGLTPAAQPIPPALPEFPEFPKLPARLQSSPADDVPSAPVVDGRKRVGAPAVTAGGAARSAEAATPAVATTATMPTAASDNHAESARRAERRRNKSGRRGLGVAVTSGCAGVIVCAFLVMGNNSGGSGGSGPSGSASSHSAAHSTGAGVVNVPQASVVGSPLSGSSGSASLSASPSPSHTAATRTASASSAASASPSATKTHKKSSPSPSPSQSHFCFLIC